ncbi:MAG: hydrolase, partial [Paludibacteraceae bacterium]|nr:hydrolase [Paludibacteraceae bacterium]
LRQQPHPTHKSLKEALEAIDLIQPQRAILTHFSHDIGLHAVVSPTLPEHVQMGYDGLTVNL